MADVSHQVGSDLMFGPTGDLALADGPALTQQRVLRRLLTNPGDYLWQLDYGAGLGQFIGQPIDPGRISAVIRSQVFKEAAVARTPEPTVDVAGQPTGAAFVHVRYADGTDAQTYQLTFSIPGS